MTIETHETGRTDHALALALGAVAAGALILAAVFGVSGFDERRPGPPIETSGANTLYPTQ